MVRTTIGLLIVLLMAGATFAGAEDDNARVEAEIKKVIESYVAAFNRGDAADVASYWTENGAFTGPSGEYIEGRKELEKAFKKVLTESKGIALEVKPIAIHVESPDEVIEEGIAVTTVPGEDPVTTRYSAAYTRENGAWKMTRVREIALPDAVSHYDKLKGLEWMIGDWVDEGLTGTLETSCWWTPDRNFIVRAYALKAAGLPLLRGKQIIAWDPAEKKIRSWVFDSTAILGEGTWTEKDGRWLVNVTLTLSNGTRASSINVFTPIDENSFTWQATGREVGGVPLPNSPEVTVIRKAASEAVTQSDKK